MKKILYIVLLLIGVIAGTAVYLVYNVDSIVAGIIENSGTAAVGTPVKVGAVEIDIGKGRAMVRDLTVANPPGFSAKPALRFGVIEVEIEVPSLKIERVYAREPAIRVETRGGDSNFAVLKRNISAAPPGPEQGSSGDAMQISIASVEIERASAVIASDLKAQEISREISNITLRNLHGTPNQVAGQIASQLVARIIAATATNVLEQKLSEKLGTDDGGSGRLKGALEKLLK